MSEFFSQCFSDPHLPYTVWLLFNLAYWLIVIIGVLDVDTFDIDVPEADVDVDVDVPAEGVGDAAEAASMGMSAAVLHFFHVGHVPLTVLLTISAWSMWVVSMLIADVFPDAGLGFAFLILIPNFVASLFVAKFVSYPLKSLFRRLKQGTTDYEELSGQTCTIMSSKANRNYGQAQMIRDGAPLLINVRTMNDEELTSGEEAVIVEYNKSDNVYIVAALKWEE